MNVSLLPPIPTSFRAATALPPLISLSACRCAAANTCALRGRVLAASAAEQDSGTRRDSALLHHRNRPLERRLRPTLARLGVKGIEAADDHELHVVGVMLAGRRDAGAKLLQKALDRRHAVAIKQYAKAKDEDALRRLWNEVDAQQRYPRRLLGAAEPCDRDGNDRQESISRRAHAFASGRRRQMGQAFAGCVNLSRRTVR